MVRLDSDGALMKSIDFTLDAAMTEKHSRKVTISKHPIETGAKPTDHAELDPRTYVVEGVFTNVPISDIDQQRIGLLDGTALDGSYSKTMSDALDELLEMRQPMTISTELRLYTNMVMTTLDLPRDPSIGEAIQFSATFEEVRFVQTQTVALQPPKTKVPTKPNGIEKKGTVVATPTDPATKATVLKMLADWGGFTKSGSGKR